MQIKSSFSSTPQPLQAWLLSFLDIKSLFLNRKSLTNANRKFTHLLLFTHATRISVLSTTKQSFNAVEEEETEKWEGNNKKKSINKNLEGNVTEICWYTEDGEGTRKNDWDTFLRQQTEKSCFASINRTQ